MAKIVCTDGFLLRPTGRNADTFGYDARSQLTAATLRSSATNAFAYAYDSAGNRSAAVESGVATSYTANELNQYSAISEDLPEYDPDGNLLTNGVWSYGWDAENRLTAAYSNDVCVVSNAYDAFSRRVLKVTPTKTHTFLYDGWNVVREVVRDSATGFVTDSFDYYWGRDLSGSLQGAGGVGGLVAYTRSGSLRIPVYDHIGNVVAVVDDSGTVLAAYEYAPFGDIVAQSGAEADKVPFRFSTKYFDSETGLYYYGYRFYAPLLGRWINRDPIEEEGGENLYAIVANNPMSKVDVLGMTDYCSCLKITELSVAYVNHALNFRRAKHTYVNISDGGYSRIPLWQVGTAMNGRGAMTTGTTFLLKNASSGESLDVNVSIGGSVGAANDDAIHFHFTIKPYLRDLAHRPHWLRRGLGGFGRRQAERLERLA